jgi:hypothetical protein
MPTNILSDYSQLGLSPNCRAQDASSTTFQTFLEDPDQLNCSKSLEKLTNSLPRPL